MSLCCLFEIPEIPEMLMNSNKFYLCKYKYVFMYVHIYPPCVG